jgi:6-phosphofructokinase 1
MPERRVGVGRITSERSVLNSFLRGEREFDTSVRVIGETTITNPATEDELGLYRSGEARKAVIADTEMLHAFEEHGSQTVPTFLEAGPRARLYHDPHTVKVAIVTTGGLAPGIHCTIHSIVKRHWHTYRLGAAQGRIYGVYNGFDGLCRLAESRVKLELTPELTEQWLDQGGSKLGLVRGEFVRGDDEPLRKMVNKITDNLRQNGINILYVIGGDGSLRVAHQIAEANPTRSIVGIPKTMDNDILWVWNSFGFDTAVEQATRVINTLRNDAEATRRVSLIELFGAESGFVAANATLASGHVNAVLIPEVFNLLESSDDANTYLRAIAHWVAEWAQDPRHHPVHGVMVVAEGVGTIFQKRGWKVDGAEVTKSSFVGQLMLLVEREVAEHRGEDLAVYLNQPRHYIRAVPANSHDQIYCERLGALAVDNALAGYTGFMISQWLSEYVLVPMALLKDAQKSIPVNGMFWKQVVSSTGQPLSPAERSASGSHP